MSMSRSKLYTVLLVACGVGYTWLILNYNSLQKEHPQEFGFCIFKHVTGIPCPSCGSTRSVISIIQGDILGGFIWNPIGFLILAIMIIVPLWIIRDLVFKQNSLFLFYNKTEDLIKKRLIAIPAIILILIIWIWNIWKGI